MMSQLKPHPLEPEADRIITDLGGDLMTMKQIKNTGTSYNFIFNSENDGGITTYLAFPTYVPSRSDNLFRLEFMIGTIKTESVGRALFAITLDLDLQRHTPLRVIPRTKDHRTYQIILQTVCNVDFVNEGFLASTTIMGLELATYYGHELLK